jgi:hypothetical protein
MSIEIQVEYDLYALFKEQQALEFNEWVNSIEQHVNTLKTKLCTSCKQPKLEVISLHKAECNNCHTLNDF